MILAAVRRPMTKIEAWCAAFAARHPFLAGIVHSLLDRLCEWLLAGFTLAWGITLARSDVDTFAQPSFRVLAAWMPEEWWAIACCVGGTCRLGLLIINGGWKKSPHFRIAAAACTGVFWAVISYGLREAQVGSTGAGVYALCALAEAVNALRASRDAGYNDQQGAGRGVPARHDA